MTDVISEALLADFDCSNDSSGGITRVFIFDGSDAVYDKKGCFVRMKRKQKHFDRDVTIIER